MNFLEAVRSGKPFRRPCWVKSEKNKNLWCIYLPDVCSCCECQIVLENGEPFGDVNQEVLFADDFEIKE